MDGNENTAAVLGLLGSHCDLCISLNPQLEVQRRINGKASDLSTTEGRQEME